MGLTGRSIQFCPLTVVPVPNDYRPTCLVPLTLMRRVLSGAIVLVKCSKGNPKGGLQ